MLKLGSVFEYLISSPFKVFFSHHLVFSSDTSLGAPARGHTIYTTP